ncbi:MAG: hypothetical protein L0Y79_04665 [Chlorobi bacterium]|nr:hypothetical protein [Chlorobiota bacterium]MCI0716011.1 hypothetical protein [Chlorobiota bacterium]
MFQDFAKRKFENYLSLADFTAGRISFSQMRTSGLPVYIMNFFEFYVRDKNLPINKYDFEEILNKAIVFNINYIIKPKNTILKFLFSELETRPVEFVLNRIKYFQFYGYYTDQIINFININSPEIVSSNQISQLIDGINKKILEEINSPKSDLQRMNLVKLLYYFFHDLGDNNPINLKLPKKILSAYFHDKGFYEIKKRIDNFFSDEIFIQESIELMNPLTKKSRKKSDVEVSEKDVKEIVNRAKTGLIDKEESVKEVEKIFHPEEKIPEELLNLNIKVVRREAESPASKEEKSKEHTGGKEEVLVDDEIYSDDLIFASKFKDMDLPEQPGEEERLENLISDLFCEESYKRKIIKRIFSKNEIIFKDSVREILNKQAWEEAIPLIEDLFKIKRVDYLSEEAVKFVDILQSYFYKNTFSEGRSENKAVYGEF